MTPTTTLLTSAFLASIGVQEIVLFAFYIATAIYVIFTGIFYYHWQAYGTNKKTTWTTYVVYLATTLPLMTIMGLLAITI
jgi:tellurite resistance protein TehA-like permease